MSLDPIRGAAVRRLAALTLAHAAVLTANAATVSSDTRYLLSLSASSSTYNNYPGTSTSAHQALQDGDQSASATSSPTGLSAAARSTPGQEAHATAMQRTPFRLSHPDLESIELTVISEVTWSSSIDLIAQEDPAEVTASLAASVGIADATDPTLPWIAGSALFESMSLTPRWESPRDHDEISVTGQLLTTPATVPVDLDLMMMVQFSGFCSGQCVFEGTSMRIWALKMPVGTIVDFGDGRLAGPNRHGVLYIDDWQAIPAIPEPGAWALGLAGLCIALPRLRGRRSAAQPAG